MKTKTSKYKTGSVWLFKKNNGKNGLERKANIQDRLASKVARLMLTIQSKFARHMNRLFLNVSPSRMKQLLVLFCGITCLLSSYFIIKAFKSNDAIESFNVEQSKTPGFFDKTGEALIENRIVVDEEIFSKVQLFRRYMDSLKVSDSAKYDSIQRQRPGLLDSIAILETLYYSQKIK